jgi:hypothetical protein
MVSRLGKCLSDKDLLCIDAKNICEYAENLKCEAERTYSTLLHKHCFDLHMPSGKTWVEARPFDMLKGTIKRVGCLFEISPLTEDFLSRLPPVGSYKNGQKFVIREVLAQAMHLIAIAYM